MLPGSYTVVEICDVYELQQDKHNTEAGLHHGYCAWGGLILRLLSQRSSLPNAVVLMSCFPENCEARLRQHKRT